MTCRAQRINDEMQCGSRGTLTSMLVDAVKALDGGGELHVRPSDLTDGIELRAVWCRHHRKIEFSQTMSFEYIRCARRDPSQQFIIDANEYLASVL